MSPEPTHHFPPEVPSLPFETPAGVAQALLSETDERCAVVTIDGTPYAVVTGSEVSEMTPEVTVGRQVRWVVVDVGGTAGELETLELFQAAAWRWMLLSGRLESAPSQPAD